MKRILAGIMSAIMLCTIILSGSVMHATEAAESSIVVSETVTLSSHEYNMNGTSASSAGFYFVVSPADKLAADPYGWTTRYLAVEGGIYVNGELKSSSQLIKTDIDRYWVNLSEAETGVVIQEGDKVTINGIFGDGTTYVKYESATFQYMGSNKWKLLSEIDQMDRDSSKVADLCDTLGVSQLKLNAEAQTELGAMQTTTGIAFCTKVNLAHTDFVEFKIALSKTDKYLWDLDGSGSGWQFWFRPQDKQVFIGYGVSEYAVFDTHEYKSEFLLEIGQRNVLTDAGDIFAREIYILIDGDEVLNWIDQDFDRPLGKYIMAYASAGADITLEALTEYGYMPVEADCTTTDIYDTTNKTILTLEQNSCMNLGIMDDVVNHSLKMNLTLNQVQGDYPEVKFAIGKTQSDTLWEPEGSGYQFWLRPAFQTISIGYGVSDCAKTVHYQFPQSFQLEMGACNISYHNGKQIGVKVFIRVNGEEVLSWVDTDTNRILGKNIVAYTSPNMDVEIATLLNLTALPVTFLVNGEEKAECPSVEVLSNVLVGHDSSIKVIMKKDPSMKMSCKNVYLNDICLTPEEVIYEGGISEYVYLLKEPQATDNIIVEVEGSKLSIDEPTILDFYDVAGVKSLNVNAHEDKGIGSMLYQGEACGVNTAIQFIVDIPDSFDAFLLTMLGDRESVWSYRGATLQIKDGEIALAYTATQRVLAEVKSTLFVPGRSVVVELGIVKCYEDGVYKYDRHYVKAGETLDSMKLLLWYDNTQRGGYGTGVISRGADVDGSVFTIRTAKNIYSVTDGSSDSEKLKLQTIDAIGETRYAVFYQDTIEEGETESIKLYTKEGMKLQSLRVSGEFVDYSIADDGAYICEVPNVANDLEFSYTIVEDNASYNVTAEATPHLEVQISQSSVQAAAESDVFIKTDKGYLLDRVLINNVDYTKYFVYDELQRGWKGTISGVREDKVLQATAVERKHDITVVGAEHADIILGGDINEGKVPTGGEIVMTVTPHEGYLIQESKINGDGVAISDGVLNQTRSYIDDDKITVEVVLLEIEEEEPLPEEEVEPDGVEAQEIITEFTLKDFKNKYGQSLISGSTTSDVEAKIGNGTGSLEDVVIKGYYNLSYGNIIHIGGYYSGVQVRAAGENLIIQWTDGAGNSQEGGIFYYDENKFALSLSEIEMITKFTFDKVYSDNTADVTVEMQIRSPYSMAIYEDVYHFTKISTNTLKRKIDFRPSGAKLTYSSTVFDVQEIFLSETDVQGGRYSSGEYEGAVYSHALLHKKYTTQLMMHRNQSFVLSCIDGGYEEISVHVTAQNQTDLYIEVRDWSGTRGSGTLSSEIVGTPLVGEEIRLSIEFVREGDDINVGLYVNGQLYNNQYLKVIKPRVGSIIEYECVTEGDIHIGASVQPKATGAQLATDRDCVKMGFDFSEIMDTIAENGEVVEAYGAVLVAGTKDADTLKKQARIMIDNQTLTDGYYKRTVGSLIAGMIPDEYTVTITNSGDPENMGKRASAIGYVVTDKYIYYTANQDIAMEQRVNKSVMGLLKEIFTDKYLADYNAANTQAAKDQTPLGKALTSYNSDREAALRISIDTINEIIKRSKSTVEDRAILSEVHFELHKILNED